MADTPPPTIGPERHKGPYYMDPNDIESEFSKVPLFMNSLPEEENDTLNALQALAYDGTPEEIAENFKNQGNDCFREGKLKYNDAITFYTRAIDTDCSDHTIMEACYSNRAAVNIKLGNYGRAIQDCANCLKLNPKNVKALYRSATALMSIGKLDQALDCCLHGLNLEPANAAILEVQRNCLNLKKEEDDRIRAKEESIRKAKEAKTQLDKAIKARGIKMVVTDKDVRANAEIQYDVNTDSLQWPVFFLYPEHKESDHIQQFSEKNTFMDHLEVMFEQPAPWDTACAYTPDSVEVYFENNEGVRPRLIKIGKKLSLGKVLSLDQFVVTNGVPSFILLVKNSAFKDTFLAKYK